MRNSRYIHNWKMSLVDNRFRLILHLVLFFLILFLGFQNVYGKFNKEGFLYAYTVSVLLFAIPIYLNLYWLVPHFLDKHKLWHYWAAFSALILITSAIGFALLYPLHQQYGINEFSLQDGRPFSFLGFIHSILVLMLIVSGCISFVLFRRWIIYGKRIMELEKATMQAELQQLKNQINPHFLFNMLNNANILVQEAPDEASRVLMRLNDLLRYQFNDSTRKEVYLNADIQFLTSFLELEKVRRDHFEYLVSTEGNINAVRIPPLLFIPFVENAVKHNPDSNNLSFVHLYFIVRDEELIFRCENSKPCVPVKSKGGLGLANVQRRLDLLYGSGYTLQIEDLESTYSVNLHLKL
ncbi:sensor histidine kinase [uncultured Bacteroides sp.]|uniref:sensor histidine kinase n=1 Tax=uncultured Bacteroides sp. TaxID=162156 RepID=UPI0025D6E5AF|nr:histidine kinase [uncultured Bacteroides sp.]